MILRHVIMKCHYGHSTGTKLECFSQEHNQVLLLAGIEPASLNSDRNLQRLLAHNKIIAFLLPYVVILEQHISPYRPESTLYIISCSF